MKIKERTKMSKILQDVYIIKKLEKISDDEDCTENIAEIKTDHSEPSSSTEHVEEDDDLSDEEVFNSDHDSESEQEGDSLSYTIFNNTDSDNEFIFGKDDLTFWKTTPLEEPLITEKNIVNVLPGPTKEAKNVSTPLESFTKLITIDMVDKIVLYTNMYIEEIQARYSRKRDCLVTSRSEILALFGILFHIGVKKENLYDVNELWTNDGTGMQLLRAAMGQRRFIFLLAALRFDNHHTRDERRKTDKLAPIREIFDLFVSNIKNYYIMSECVTVDEMLQAFRGRCSWIQFMAKKTAKYGIKMHALCDSKTFYCGNLEVYVGKQPEGKYNNSNKPVDIVMRMVEPIVNSNRNVTTDNWYTSMDLVTALLEKKLTFIGAIRKDERELPPELLPNKRNQIGSCTFAYQDDRMMVSYTPKKNRSIILLSSAHDLGRIDEGTRKPEVIVDYNYTKGGVECHNKLCAAYDVSRKTRRWPLRIFYALMNIAGVNSCIIYLMAETQREKNQPGRRIFLKTLGLELMKEHMYERSKITCLPYDVKAFLNLKYKLPPEPQPKQLLPLKKRGSCFMCGRARNSSTTCRCSGCNKFICKGHSGVICNKCSKTSEENEYMSE